MDIATGPNVFEKKGGNIRVQILIQVCMQNCSLSEDKEISIENPRFKKLLWVSICTHLGPKDDSQTLYLSGNIFILVAGQLKLMFSDRNVDWRETFK